MRLSLILVFLWALAAPAAAYDVKPHRDGSNAYSDNPRGAETIDLSWGDIDGDDALIWRGQTLKTFEGYMGIWLLGAFPSLEKPSLVLFGANPGGLYCNLDLIVVDMASEPPRVHDTVEGCAKTDFLWTGTRLLVANDRDGYWSFIPGADSIKGPEWPLERRVQAGEEAFSKGNFATAWHYLWPVRDGRDRRAPYLLGRMIEKGNGIDKDERLSIAYIHIAMELGSDDAATRLGELADLGIRGPDGLSGEAYRRIAFRNRWNPHRDPLADPKLWLRWEAKYPQEKILGRTLFEVEGFRTRLRELIDEKTYAELAANSRAWITNVDGEVLLVAGCMSHPCGSSDLYSILTELKEGGRTAICFLESGASVLGRNEILAATGFEARRRVADAQAPQAICDWNTLDIEALIAPLRLPPDKASLFDVQ